MSDELKQWYWQLAKREPTPFETSAWNAAAQDARNEERSLGPCGKHPKACYVDSEKIVSVGHGEITRGYCSICAASASPCGQKFSNGTPHPASLWRPCSMCTESGCGPNGKTGFPFSEKGVPGHHDYTPEAGFVRPCDSYCLICQSEETVRHEADQRILNIIKASSQSEEKLGEHRIESDRQTEHWAEIVKKQGAELATLREGLRQYIGAIEQGDLISNDDRKVEFWDSLAKQHASLLAPPPTARGEKEINPQFRKAGKEFGNC